MDFHPAKPTHPEAHSEASTTMPPQDATMAEPSAETTVDSADVAAAADGASLEAVNNSETTDWEQKYRELYEQYLRLAADFDNFRKRRLQEMEHARKYGGENTILELLPFLDNLERARASLSEGSDAKVLYQSFGLVQQQLMDALSSIGLQRVSAKGQPFNPTEHEAIAQFESADWPDQTVMEEQQGGYRLHDRLIRPARVVVSVAPTSAANPAEPGAATDENPFRQATSGGSSVDTSSPAGR
ncbi:MAG: nucleotide exchange factor GrpE [Candidatus Melainabacteria bacterium]|nr:nucleotide exchange factor GrpE [Candidatus Melainabacteria bacterium]